MNEAERQRIRAEAKLWAEKEMARYEGYPEPRHDAEILSFEEIEARASALKRARIREKKLLEFTEMQAMVLEKAVKHALQNYQEQLDDDKEADELEKAMWQVEIDELKNILRKIKKRLER